MALLVLESPSVSCNQNQCQETDMMHKTALHQYDTFCIKYESFDDFNLTNLKCDLLTEIARNNITSGLIMSTAFYWPTQRLSFTRSLDMRNISHKLQLNLGLKFYSIDWFLLNASPIILLENSRITTIFHFQNTHFDFYYQPPGESARIIDADACRKMVAQLSNETAGDPSFFSTSTQTQVYLWKNNRFPNKMCPVLFKDSNLAVLQVEGIQEEHFVTNLFEFFQFYNSEAELKLERHLNSRIHTLKMIRIYRMRLGNKTLDRHVFAETVNLAVCGTLVGIDTDTFKNMPSLRDIHVELYNVHQFFHASDNKWMAYLNYGNPNSSVLAFYLSDYSQTYLYPNEDFCLFKHFPKRQGAVFVVTNSSVNGNLEDMRRKMNEKLLMTCTLKYMHDIFVYYLEQNLPSFRRIRDALVLDTSFIPECNFTKMISACNQIPFIETKDNNMSPSEWSYQDITYVFEWFEFVGPVLTLPLVGFAGFVTNLIIIIVLNKKTFAKDFEEKMYSFMNMNAVFNCLECLLSLFQMMSTCININSNVFCSAVQEYLIVQYFRVYVVGYGGEVFKTCSILASIAFSLQRYIATSKSESIVLRKILAVSSTKFYTAVVLVSALSSVSKIYEYHTLKNITLDEVSFFPEAFYISPRLREHMIWHILYFFHYILNDLVLWLVCGFIDICLIRVIKANMKEKERILARLDNKQLQSEQKSVKGKVEEKINRIIVANIVVYSTCRFPELALMIAAYFVDLSETIFDRDCSTLRLCYLLSDFIQYLYMISYTTNIYFYFKFNLSFEKNLRKFLHMKPIRIVNYKSYVR